MVYFFWAREKPDKSTIPMNR